MTDTTRIAARGAPRALIRWAASSDTDRCIVWPYGRTLNGYGKVAMFGSTMSASRAVLLLTSDPPSSAHHAAHKPIVCHNRLCINPRHLRWATPTENSMDRIKDGTVKCAVGQHSGQSKLNCVDVLAIRSSSLSNAALAAQFSVSSSTIRSIRLRHTWGWLTPDNAASATRRMYNNSEG